jgi:CAAX prenyl protease-like protein
MMEKGVAPISAAGIILSIVIFYGTLLRRALVDVEPLTQLALRWRSARRFALADVEAIIRITAGGLLQLAFCWGLLTYTGLSLGEVHLLDVDPAILVLGVALGVGEAALATFFGYVGVRVGLAVAPTRTPHTTDEWLSLARSGWMRLFLRAVEANPVVAVVLSLLYIMVEETIFRGILLTALADSGATWALPASVLLFCVAQTFGMPSWQSALFPVMGAIVIGVIHGLLFLSVPLLLPLLVAHCVFFLVVMI